jgi:hypothetical protein
MIIEDSDLGSLLTHMLLAWTIYVGGRSQPAVDKCKEGWSKQREGGRSAKATADMRCFLVQGWPSLVGVALLYHSINRRKR